MDIKEKVAKAVSKAGILGEAGALKLLETPRDPKMGDLALPCFSLAREKRKDPKAIATDLARKVKPSGPIREVKQTGPYVNFFLDWAGLGRDILGSVLKEGDHYGSQTPKKKLSIVVEYPAPNTNKPLHLGHLRNMALGSSISSVFKFLGHRVHEVNLNNDRGIHICKSMLAYRKWGRGIGPKKKSDHFVGDWYVRFAREAASHPELEEEAKEMLRKWEAKDPDTVLLWKKMNKWALDGYKETYRRFGVSFEKEYFESETYEAGRKMVLDGLKKKIFSRDETGAIVFDLEKFGLGKKVMVRSDGTTVYITQDLYLAKEKYRDFRFDKSVYVVASEQDYHFQVLFKALEALGLKFAGDCHHLSYGMVFLPGGKMKSREGRVVDADNLMDEIRDMALREIKGREEVLDKEAGKRAEAIALAAIKYFLLRPDSVKSMTFNPEESISLEGNTGPYIQYSHARICSILKKEKPGEFDAGLLTHQAEQALLRELMEFPRVVRDSGRDLKLHYIVNYLYGLANKFNEFYESCRVLQAETPELKGARLALARAVKTVLRNGLNLLGIEALERM